MCKVGEENTLLEKIEVVAKFYAGETEPLFEDFNTKGKRKSFLKMTMGYRNPDKIPFFAITSTLRMPESLSKHTKFTWSTDIL